MKMQGSYTFEAPLETVWNALFDPDVLARTLPGCEKLEREGNQFRGDINVKMGPVQGKFEGKVDIVDVKERESYKMIVDGRGPAGFGKATASLRVSSEGSGTRLDYDSDVTVGGKIASVGQRLIDASSRAIVKQSLEGLNQQIRALAAAPPAAASPAASAAGATPAAASAAQPSPLMEGSAPPAAPVAPVTATGGAAPAGAAAPAAAAPAGAGRPAAASPGVPAPPAAPSQASFVFGVAKEVAKEVFPLRTVLIAIALLVIIGLVIRSLMGG
jgi:carbon monoxide dehydrogenase subunit G